MVNTLQLNIVIRVWLDNNGEDMEIKCPRCKKQLYLRIERIYYMTITEVGMMDVIPGETVDTLTNLKLECISCEWTGWTNEYHEEQNGIANLNARRKK